MLAAERHARAWRDEVVREHDRDHLRLPVVQDREDVMRDGLFFPASFQESRGEPPSTRLLNCAGASSLHLRGLTPFGKGVPGGIG